MAKEISNGTHTVKLYNYVDRGRKMHQLAYYEAGKRRLRNFSVKSEAETMAWQILGQLTNGTEAVRAFRTPELEIRAVDLVISGVIEKQAKAKDTKALFRLLRLLVMNEANFDTKRRVAKRHGYTTMKTDGDATAFYHDLAKKAEATPVPFIVETLLWKSSLFANNGLPEATAAACKIFGLDPKKIEAEAKKKPAKAEKSEETAPKK
jgi:hypothetical protein